MYSRNIVITFLAFAMSYLAAAEIENSLYPLRTQVLRNNLENEGRLLQGQDKNEIPMSRNVLDGGDNFETDLIQYEVGTPVSVKRFDGSWTNGKIMKADKHGYTIEWDHGETYVIGLEDGEVHQMVQNSIANGNISQDEAAQLGYAESETIESIHSSNGTKESIIIVCFVVAVLAVVWYVRHKKLVAISSIKKSEGGIWGNNVQSGTTLSLQMDEHRNLRSVRNIM